MLTVPPVPAIEPTNFAPGASQQQPSLPLGTGTIVAGPDRIRDLVRPVTLDGVTTSRDPNTGQIVVQTALGLLTVNTDAELLQGAAVALRITPGAPPVATLFAQSGGQAEAEAIAAAETPAILFAGSGSAAPSIGVGQVVTLTPLLSGSGPTPSETLALPTSQQAAIPSPASGQGISIPHALPDATFPPLAAGAPDAAIGGTPATAIASLAASSAALEASPNGRPAGAPTPFPFDQSASTVEAASTAPPQIQTGEAIPTGRVIPGAMTLPGGAGPIFEGADLTGLPPALAAQLPAIARSPAAASAAAAAPLPDQSDAAEPFAGRIVSIVPPNVPATPLPPGMIAATVQGATLSGQPIIDTGHGSFVAQGVAAIPPGTQLIIQPVENTAAQRSTAPLDPVAGKEWPALAAALPALAQAHPALAEAVRLAIPQTGSLLGPVMLLFVAGLRRGEASSWIGDAPLKALREAGHGELAARLAADFHDAARQSTVAVDDGWHTLPIPLMAEGELTRLQLHLRRYPPDEDEESEATGNEPRSGVRFLIDAEPAATGPIQLDGLVRRSRAAGRPALDLIVRSRTPIAPEMRSDITRIFSDALTTSGLEGGLVFQGGVNWVKFARERAAAPSVLA